MHQSDRRIEGEGGGEDPRATARGRARTNERATNEREHMVPSSRTHLSRRIANATPFVQAAHCRLSCAFAPASAASGSGLQWRMKLHNRDHQAHPRHQPHAQQNHRRRLPHSRPPGFPLATVFPWLDVCTRPNKTAFPCSAATSPSATACSFWASGGKAYLMSSTIHRQCGT